MLKFEFSANDSRCCRFLWHLNYNLIYSWSDLIKSGTNLLCNSLLVWCSSENSDSNNNCVLNNLNCFKFVKGTCWCYRLFSLYLNNPCFGVILMGYLMAYKLYIWDAFNKYIFLKSGLSPCAALNWRIVYEISLEIIWFRDQCNFHGCNLVVQITHKYS